MFFFFLKGLQTEITRLQNKCAQLEAGISAREQEIIVADLKYRKYAEKAKEVIKNLDPRLINGINIFVFCIRNEMFFNLCVSDSVQISDRHPDSDNDLLVTSSPVRPSMGPLEERLMATAYYK